LFFPQQQKLRLSQKQLLQVVVGFFFCCKVNVSFSFWTKQKKEEFFDNLLRADLNIVFEKKNVFKISPQKLVQSFFLKSFERFGVVTFFFIFSN
jgi:hypothetical protein